MAVSVSAEALAGPVIGEVPGSPGGVRALADSWRSAARTATWSADLAYGARAAVSSSQGRSADACREASRSLVRDLESMSSRLLAGAGVLETYADVLEKAQAALEDLRRRAASVVLGALGDPAAVAGAVGALAGIAGAATNIRAAVGLAAREAAAALMDAGSDDGAQAGQTGQRASDGRGFWDFLMGKEDPTREKTELSEEDIERIRRQADGTDGWGSVDQFKIGDCYLLATLQAYSQSESGRQYLRDQIEWDEEKHAFMVTLYDNGKEVVVPVTDYYAKGNQSGPTIINIYERAYGQHFGNKDLNDGGRSKDAMKTISNQEGEHIDTHGGSGWLGWPWWDDHKYTGSEWTQIEGAVNDERPVTASTSGGGTVSDDHIDADTNNDGVFDDRDQGGDYKIVEHHTYTVEKIDDEYVTLINPWANNETSGGTHVGDGGRIRITREEYEKYFPETDIAQKTP